MILPYARITYRGHTVNRRTAAVLDQAEVIYHLLGGRGDFHLAQGSYNSGDGKVAASAGTHDGGGAFDITCEDMDKGEYACRLCGVAAWRRDELIRNGVRIWGPHIHGEVIGDRELSQGALSQVHDYYAGLNGLADHSRDNHRRPEVIVTFRYPLQRVKLTRIREEALKGGTGPKHQVRVVQRALNLKRGIDLSVDGLFGPVTKRAYGRYEKQVGGDGDGLPSEYALTLLGAALFTVIKE